MKFLQTALVAGLMSATSLSVPAMAGGVLRLDEVAVGELDPAKASDFADSILMFNVYDTLVLPTQGGPGHTGHLAKSWTGDGTSFTFVLRDGVTFQSGNALTADDVVFSVERMKYLGAGLSYLLGVVERVEAIDASTVRFTLSSPYSPFVASLVRLPIVDKQLVLANLGEGEGEMGDWGQAFLSGNSAGTGAYSVSSHNPQEETVMQKNRDYFLGVADAAPDTVRLRYGLEAATVRALIGRGEHDISSQWLPPEVMGALVKEGAQLLTESGTGAFYFKMNTTKAPLDDVNCRLALSAAFDYETAIKMIAITDEVSAGSPSTGAIPVGMFGANDTSMVQKQNMDQAKIYLDACQYAAADMDIEISWIAEVPLEERFALLMQSNFTQLGVKSHIKKLPWALFAEQVSKPENTPNISQLFVNAVTGDPDTLLYGMYHSSTPGTWQSPEYLNDAMVDQYLDEGRSADSEITRTEAYTKLNARLMEIAPTIYGFDRQSVYAASNRVKAPALSDPAHAFGLDGMGFSFRLMEMTE
jgi:peptide/nickel transport system substrate-binding protein